MGSEQDTPCHGDVGCSLCKALPDQFCVTASGKVCADHAVRIKARATHAEHSGTRTGGD